MEGENKNDSTNIGKNCKCYGCIKKLSCKCSNCQVKKTCKTSFCIFVSVISYQCNICFTQFRSFDFLKKHRIKANHFKKEGKKNIDLPKATWMDMYMSGEFEKDISVKSMTQSKMLKYKTSFKKVKRNQKFE